MIAAALLLLAGERVAVGVWDRWAAFSDTQPRRCFAVAQPVDATGRTDTRGAFASVATRVGAARADVVFFRLARARAPGAAVTLAIDERRFALTGDAASARAPDAATARAIVGAMRGGRSMSLTTVSRAGRPLADSYTLDGAATAIDAAGLACVERR